MEEERVCDRVLVRGYDDTGALRCLRIAGETYPWVDLDPSVPRGARYEKFETYSLWERGTHHEELGDWDHEQVRRTRKPYAAYVQHEEQHMRLMQLRGLVAKDAAQRRELFQYIVRHRLVGAGCLLYMASVEQAVVAYGKTQRGTAFAAYVQALCDIDAFWTFEASLLPRIARATPAVQARLLPILTELFRRELGSAGAASGPTSGNPTGRARGHRLWLRTRVSEAKNPVLQAAYQAAHRATATAAASGRAGRRK